MTLIERYHSATRWVRILLTALVLVTGLGIYAIGYGQTGLLQVFLKEGGTLLAVAVVVDLLYNLVLRAEHEDGMRVQTEKALRTWLDGLVPSASEVGLVRITGRMPFEELFADLKDGDELMFLDTFSPKQSTYEDALKSAVTRGACIRMLLIKPDGVTAMLRGAEIDDENYHDPKAFRG